MLKVETIDERREEEEIFECDGKNDAWLRGEIRKALKEKRKDERGRPKRTSFDRLDESFERLFDRGVLAEHRCGITQQDGLDVVDLLYKERGGKKSNTPASTSSGTARSIRACCCAASNGSGEVHMIDARRRYTGRWFHARGSRSRSRRVGCLTPGVSGGTIHG